METLSCPAGHPITEVSITDNGNIVALQLGTNEVDWAYIWEYTPAGQMVAGVGAWFNPSAMAVRYGSYSGHNGLFCFGNSYLGRGYLTTRVSWWPASTADYSYELDPNLGLSVFEPTVDAASAVYFGTDSNKLLACWAPNFTTCTQVWSLDVVGKVRSSPAIGYDETLYFGTDQGMFYAVSSDPAAPADFDSDGMSDSWEIQHFGNITNSAGDASEDWDRDGMSDFGEYIAGTDPTNNNSIFKITDILQITTNLVFTWSTITGRYYTVQTTTNIMNSLSWTPVPDPAYTNILGMESSLSYTNTDPVDVQRFFRVKVRAE